MNVTPLEQLTHASFAALAKTKFRVWLDPQHSLELELEEVSPLRVSAGGPKNVAYENFALLFRGPADPLLPQRIYGFESAALGRFELFIVPASSEARGIQYQATFNRQVS